MNYFSEIVSIAVQEWDLVVAQWLAESWVLFLLPPILSLATLNLERANSMREDLLAPMAGAWVWISALLKTNSLVQLRIKQLCFDLPLIQKVVDKKNPEIIFNFFFVFLSFFFHFILVRCLSSERCQTLGGLCQNRFLSLAPIFYQYHDLPY